MKLYKKWDSVGCLALLDAKNSDPQYRCGLFAVYKNAEKDRQILNPIPENGRTMCMNSSTLTLAHGSLLCDLRLGPDQDLLIGADDLKEDFYHGFKVHPSHAHRNHIHGVFPADVFRGWNVWSSDLEGKQLVGCFNTLAMGTSYAVEVAQHTHTNLLRRAGLLSPLQQVCYRKPLPRSGVLQLLCIDDLAVLQKVPRGLPEKSHKVFRHDIDLLEKAGNAYQHAGLRTSSKKSERNETKATILGEIDGRRGILCAPRLRILMLSKLTLRLVQIGSTTKLLLETIIGSWIFVLLFRRPLLAILNDVFHEGSKIKSRDEIFCLSTGAKQELLLLTLWAPFAYTNLRSSPLSQIFCSDASLAGCGVCSAAVSTSTTLELCRISEQKGFYTRIDSSTLGCYDAVQDGGISLESKIPPPLQEGFLWDGHLSQGHREAGLSVHPGFDISGGEVGDVLAASTFLSIIGLICRRVVRVWHVAPVCTTFGTLRRPRLRSKLEPFGFNPCEPATSLGNRFAIRGGFILFLCHFFGLICRIEQPRGSVMYRLDIYQMILQFGFFSVTFPFCSWGTPFQKLSWWLGNNPFLCKLRSSCSCGQKGAHFRVQGTFDNKRLRQFSRLCKPSVNAVFDRSPQLGEHVARFSGAYPKPLCGFHCKTKPVEDFAVRRFRASQPCSTFQPTSVLDD